MDSEIKKFLLMDGKRFILTLCCLLLLGGCGYTAASRIPDAYNTIYVPPFRMDPLETETFKADPQFTSQAMDQRIWFAYDVQAAMTDALRRKFIADGRLQVRNRAEESDLTLEGAFTQYALDPFTRDNDDNVTEFRVFVSAAVALVDNRTGEVVWKEPDLRGTTTFFARPFVKSPEARAIPPGATRGNTDFFTPEVRSFSSRNESQGVTEAIEDLASNIFLWTVEYGW